MNNTILNLWKGQLCPAEDYKITEEYKLLQQKLVEAEERLLENADEKTKMYFKKFDDTLVQIGIIDENNAFYQGFRLGVKLVFEALS